MAKDNNNGLYLPLKIDLSAWEQSLSQADADLQRAMREMRSSVSDMKLRYDVEIAKNAGNELKKLELQNAKLTAVYNAQKQAVEALNLAYEKSVKEKGEFAKETQALARALINETKAMERSKAQLDAVGVGFGKKISDSLASLSPEFAKVRQSVAGLTTDIGKLGGQWLTVGKAIGGVGLVVGAGVAAVKGAESLVNSYKEIGIAAAQANEEVYQLREELNESYENAELLAGAARIDGTNLQELGSALNKMNRQLDETGENTSNASKWLERYGAVMRNGDGTRKTVIEQMQELSKAFQKAELEGNGRDFLANTIGNASDKFMHFIRGFDDYMSRAASYRAELEKDYETAHAIMDLQKERLEVERQLASAKGNAALGSTAEIMKIEIAALQEQYQWYRDNADAVDEYGKNLVELQKNLTAISSTWEGMKFNIKTGGMEMLNGAIDGLADFGQKLRENEVANNVLKAAPFPGVSMIAGLANAAYEARQRKEEQNAIAMEQENMREIAQMDKILAEEEAKKEAARRKEEEAEKKANEKRLKAEEQFQRTLRDLTSTEYERQVNRIQDKLKLYIDAGMSEVQAAKLVAIEKENIDRQYFEKQQQELAKQTKATKDAYDKQIAEAKRFSEEQKRAREQSMSEAETTLRNNVKLLRYIQNEQKKGTFTEEGAKEYANKLYMRQNGFNMNDVSFMKDFGVGRLQELADARTRIFGQFAETPTPSAPVTSNVTVNFDNTVVEDASAMDKLANKVAEIITPAIQQALRGGEYTY